MCYMRAPCGVCMWADVGSELPRSAGPLGLRTDSSDSEPVWWVDRGSFLLISCCVLGVVCAELLCTAHTPWCFSQEGPSATHTHRFLTGGHMGAHGAQLLILPWGGTGVAGDTELTSRTARPPPPCTRMRARAARESACGTSCAGLCVGLPESSGFGLVSHF